MRFSGAALLLMFILSPAVSMAGGKRIVPAEESASHVAKWVKPEYPSLARIAHLQGDVIVQVSISKSGAVSNVRVKSGHPMLAQAAVDAVERWRFHPFEEEGKAVAVEALIKIQFPPGDSPEEAKEPPTLLAEFSEVMQSCREEIHDRNAVDAEPLCRKAVVLASALDPSRQLERMNAFEQTGHALFLQNKFAEALENYRQELQIAVKAVEPHGAELGAAHQHTGNGLWATGKKEEARVEYEQAEIIYEAAEASASSAFLRNEYAKARKAVLHDHATLLRQLGQKEEAEFLDQQADAIMVKGAAREEKK
jgi:TonB family protein